MQSRNLILILSIGALAAFGGCERHYWEDTRKLHQDHGEHPEKGESDPHEKVQKGDHGKKPNGEHAKEGSHSKPKAKAEKKGSDEKKAEGKTRTL